ncbi:hypothetical protein ACJJTC_002285 [Scirpophaga incertulas]
MQKSLVPGNLNYVPGIPGTVQTLILARILIFKTAREARKRNHVFGSLIVFTPSGRSARSATPVSAAPNSVQLRRNDLALFSRPNSAEMCSKIVDLLLGCSSRDIGQTDLFQDHREPQSASTSGISTQDRQISNKDELNLEIQKAIAAPNPKSASDIDISNISSLDSLVKVEMALWENGGHRGHYLTIALKH